jgi:hypothetical protein
MKYKIRPGWIVRVSPVDYLTLKFIDFMTENVFKWEDNSITNSLAKTWFDILLDAETIIHIT